MNNKSERLSYGVDEAARMLGLSISSVRKHIREGKLPAKKLGARTIILAADLQRVLSELSPARLGAR